MDYLSVWWAEVCLAQQLVPTVASDKRWWEYKKKLTNHTSTLHCLVAHLPVIGGSGSPLIHFHFPAIKRACCFLNSHKFLASTMPHDKLFYSITASCEKYFFLLGLELPCTCFIWYSRVLTLKNTVIPSPCHSYMFSPIHLSSTPNT